MLPNRVTPEGFAAYDNLLVATTLSGEPLGYQGGSFKVGDGRIMGVVCNIGLHQPASTVVCDNHDQS